MNGVCGLQVLDMGRIMQLNLQLIKEGAKPSMQMAGFTSEKAG